MPKGVIVDSGKFTYTDLLVSGFTPTNYTPADSTIEGHLDGIDDALAGAGTPDLADVLAVDNETDGTTANSIRVLQSGNISNIFFETDIVSDDDFSTGDSWVGIRGTRTLTVAGINDLQFLTYAGRSADTAYSGVFEFADDSVGLSTPKVVARIQHQGSHLQFSALRASTTKIILGNGGSGTGGIEILPSGATRTIHTSGANALGLGTNSTTYLTISSAGDVTFGGSSTVTIDTLHGNGDGSNLGATATGDRWDRVYLRGYINWQSSDLVNPTTANEVNLCPSAGALYMAFDANERLGFFGLGSGTCRIQATVAGGVLELEGAAGVMVSRLSNGVGFFGTTPVTQQAAYTQTYATATRTHAARAAASLTDNSGGTADATIAAITNANNAGSADVTPTANAIADLAAQVNNLITDQANTAQVLNQLIDDLQLHGLSQ